MRGLTVYPPTLRKPQEVFDVGMKACAGHVLLFPAASFV
jgi:hypothetical protein